MKKKAREPGCFDPEASELPMSLVSALDQLAEYAHEACSDQRRREGWSRGPSYDAASKQDPDLVAFSELPRAARDRSLEVVRAVLKGMLDLGFELHRPEPAMVASPADEFGDARRELEALRHRAEGMLRAGDPLRAFDEVEQALEAWPQDLRLRQLKGLALARSGALDRARHVFSDLEREGHRDGETLGPLARTYKELARNSVDPETRRGLLEKALGHYERAYRISRESGDDDGACYTGVNAATMALLLDRLESATSLARAVQELGPDVLSLGPVPARAYWIHASLAEAALVLGEQRVAESEYARAAGLVGGRFADLVTTRQQARWVLLHRGEDASWLDSVLQIPPVAAIVQTAYRLRSRPFSPELLEPLRAQTHSLAGRIQPCTVYGSAAPGADGLFLDEALAHGAEIHITLPYPAEDFRRAHLSSLPEWQGHFDRLLESSASLTVASDDRAEHSRAAALYGSLFQLGLAVLRARALDTEFVPVVIREPNVEHLSEAERLIEPLVREGMHVEFLDAPPAEALEGELSTSSGSANATSPTRFAHQLVAMVFADAVGYSRLSEDQIPLFVDRFLGSVADLLGQLARPPLLTETMGDGLYLVFSTVEEAARFALDMSEQVSSRDWSRVGLPADLDLRIGLHCGPVFSCVDPVSGQPKFTGPHTSRTARIEPVTPAGQVYASQAFAAVAAATGFDDVAFEYVGRTSLAKKYGSLPLYHVRRIDPR